MLAPCLPDHCQQLGGVDFGARHVRIPVRAHEVTMRYAEREDRLGERFKRNLNRREDVFPTGRASACVGNVRKNRENILVLIVGQATRNASIVVKNPNIANHNSAFNKGVNGLETVSLEAEHEAVPCVSPQSQFGQNRGRNMAKQTDLPDLMKSNDTARAISAQEFKKVG